MISYKAGRLFSNMTQSRLAPDAAGHCQQICLSAVRTRAQSDSQPLSLHLHNDALSDTCVWTQQTNLELGFRGPGRGEGECPGGCLAAGLHFLLSIDTLLCSLQPLQMESPLLPYIPQRCCSTYTMCTKFNTLHAVKSQ